MNKLTDIIKPESPEDYHAVEQLAEEAFGPGRFARSAFRLREGVMHEPDLSFTLHRVDKLVGSVKLTRILIGEDEALLLGPLVVTPDYKGCGVGAALMEKAVLAAKEAGHALILLVGDYDYYKKFGFKQVPHGQIKMPGPTDPARILVCPLVDGVKERFSGTAQQYQINRS